MSTFVVESSAQIRDSTYIFARLEKGLPPELVHGASFDGVPLANWVDQPRAHHPDGSLRFDLYAFRLLNPADLERLSAGQVVHLNLPGPHCQRCQTHWALPQVAASTLREVSDQTHRGQKLEAIRILEKHGAGPRSAKAAVLHIAHPNGHCHRCAADLPGGPEVDCPECSSFNYQW